DQWVEWRLANKQEKKKKYDKLPYCVHTGKLASSTDPDTWASFEAAREVYESGRGRWDGIGFMMDDTKPREDGLILIGIDLDHCVNPETGEIAPWAQDIIVRFASYAELSPSGTGIRIFIWARRMPGGRGGRRAGPVEVYQRERYLTVTGLRAPVESSSFV